MRRLFLDKPSDCRYLFARTHLQEYILDSLPRNRCWSIHVSGKYQIEKGGDVMRL